MSNNKTAWGQRSVWSKKPTSLRHRRIQFKAEIKGNIAAVQRSAAQRSFTTTFICEWGIHRQTGWPGQLGMLGSVDPTPTEQLRRLHALWVIPA